MAAEGALVGFLGAGEGVAVVGEEPLGGGDVYFAFVIGHQLLPAGTAGVGADGGELAVEFGLLVL